MKFLFAAMCIVGCVAFANAGILGSILDSDSGSNDDDCSSYRRNDGSEGQGDIAASLDNLVHATDGVLRNVASGNVPGTVNSVLRGNLQGVRGFIRGTSDGLEHGRVLEAIPEGLRRGTDDGVKGVEEGSSQSSGSLL